MSGTSDDGVVVRLAEPADLALLGPLEDAAGERFREVGLESVADDDPPPLAVYAEAQRRGHLWVATMPGGSDAAGLSNDATVDVRQVVGYVWVLDLNGQHHLEQVSVLPEHGGKGIGIALVEQAAAWARAGGGRSLTLSTFVDVIWNGPWYERLGFAAIDIAEQDHDPRWIELRAHEAAAGLDVTRRAVMRRLVHP